VYILDAKFKIEEIIFIFYINMYVFGVLLMKFNCKKIIKKATSCM